MLGMMFAGAFFAFSRKRLFAAIHGISFEKSFATTNLTLKSVPCCSVNCPGKLAREVKYIPLTDADYKHAADNFAKRKTGTAFGGEAEVGVKVADLLKRDPKE